MIVMRTDFDFVHGDWIVTNHKLVELFTGCEEWETFTGFGSARPILGGGGNIDELTVPDKGFTGMTIRLYDVERDEWAIYWATSRTGRLDPAVVGRFADGRGDFYGDDVVDGRPVRVHFIWSDITPTSARWEQAFSLDGGQTWERNWVMECRRRED
jgi:hypothetical protein